MIFKPFTFWRIKASIVNNVQKILLIISVVHCVGCVNNDKPKFEELVDDLFVPRIISNYTTYGVRDGALTQAYITYEFEDYKSIELKLEVTYNPTPILSSGYWKILDGDSIGGDIRANSLKFLGGQAEAPSLGGTFELNENFQTRFKVIVPLRPINKLEW